MDDAKNFVLGIFQTVKDRFGNPLVSAFVVSWAIWNFRLLLVLLGSGDGGWQTKITYIDKQLMPEWVDWGIHGFLIPIAFALLWIYILPPALRTVAAYHESSQNKTREAIFTATEARTLSAEEALNLRQVMVKQRAEWQSEKAEIVQSLENFVKKLESANEGLQAANAREQGLAKEVASLKKEIEKLKEPPPRTPYNFAGKPTKEKAAALGLQLLNRNPISPSSISFDGFPVNWPWMPTEHSRFNIPHKRLIEHPLDEEAIWGMFYLLRKYRGGGSPPQAANEWAEVFRDAGAKRPDALVRHLLLHGVLSGNYEAPEFSAQQTSSIRWLQQVGFKETETPKQQ